ncbi:MAG: HAD hydrolase-like protein [Candidatus Saelkia tenebricola]|nr:HAD hydrolase-like protein [Candidatus Saelkia tenebricola]
MKTKKEGIQIVLFDLGNVIICFDHMISARKAAEYCDKSAQEIYDIFFSSPLTESFDAGMIGEEEFFRGAKELLNLNGLNQDGFYNIWNDIFWENLGIKSLIRDIKEKYQKFIIISNVNKAHFKYIWDKFPIVREADELILSYEVGFLKPDSRIYNIAVEKSGFSPSNIFYTDDREDLIKAAARLNFKAHLFYSINDISNCLFVSN